MNLDVNWWGRVPSAIYAYERDVTSHTRRVVFLIVFSLQPLTEQLHHKRSNSSGEKILFGPTQIYA